MDPITMSLISGGIGIGSSLLGNILGSSKAQNLAKQSQAYSRENALLQMMLMNKSLKRVAPYYNLGLEGLSKYATEALEPENSDLYRIMVDDATRRLQDQFARRGLSNSAEYFNTYQDMIRRLGAEERERKIGRLQNLMNLGYSSATNTTPLQVAPYIGSSLNSGLGMWGNFMNTGLGFNQDLWNSLGNLGLGLLGYGLKGVK